MSHNMYDVPLPDDARSKIYRILNLCRVGAAATDTSLAIDLSRMGGGHCEMYEVIAQLASDALDDLEKN